MTEPIVVVGITRDEQAVIRAMQHLQAHGYGEVETFSPVPGAELIESEAKGHASPIRFYTLVGGVLGLAAGLLLTIGSARSWPLITGGKPIVSLPAFMVIVFELTMLFAGVATFASFLFYGTLRSGKFNRGYRREFSEDRFGIAVTCEPDREEQVRTLITSAGIEDVPASVS